MASFGPAPFSMAPLGAAVAVVDRYSGWSRTEPDSLCSTPSSAHLRRGKNPWRRSSNPAPTFTALLRKVAPQTSELLSRSASTEAGSPYFIPFSVALPMAIRRMAWSFRDPAFTEQHGEVGVRERNEVR